jgi:hypothetical protein
MTKVRRWSERLEAQRGGSEAAASAAQKLLDEALTILAEARKELPRDKAFAERLIVEAQLNISRATTLQATIVRLMSEAKHGL